jgi:hypothetical protein
VPTRNIQEMNTCLNTTASTRLGVDG